MKCEDLERDCWENFSSDIFVQEQETWIKVFFTPHLSPVVQFGIYNAKSLNSSLSSAFENS